MKPRNCLVYYGWLNSFNSAQNGWDNEKVAQDFAKYNLLVFGDGMQNPSHGDYANTQIIIARIKVLNPHTLIFGYVAVAQAYADFHTKVSQWDNLAIHGILMDQAGYDFGSTETNGRAAFNAKVDLVHSQLFANLCFVNSWKPRYVLGTVDDLVNFPNSTWNPDLLESNLYEYDYCLVESLAIDSSGAYENKTNWYDRGLEWKQYANTFDVKLVAISVILENDANGQDKFNFTYTSACMWEFHGAGSSDIYYGAGSAASKMWARPGIEGIFGADDSEILIRNNGDKYLRYLENGLMKMDFTTNSESSAILKY